MKSSTWIVIYMAHNPELAEAARAALEREGFMVRTRPIHRALSKDQSVEILALSSEAEEAREYLLENFEI